MTCLNLIDMLMNDMCLIGAIKTDPILLPIKFELVGSSEKQKLCENILNLELTVGNVYSAPELKVRFNCINQKVEFAITVDPDEAAHNEQPHLDLHCLPSSL